MSIANPARYDLASDSYPQDAWVEVPDLPAGELVLTPASQAVPATLMISSAEPGAMFGVDRLLTGAAEVTLAASEAHNLSIRLRSAAPRGTIQLPDEFLAVVDSCVRQGAAWPYSSQQITLRIRLPAIPTAIRAA